MAIGVGGGRGQATVTGMPKRPALFETKINWIRKKKAHLVEKAARWKLRWGRRHMAPTVAAVRPSCFFVLWKE